MKPPILFLMPALVLELLLAGCSHPSISTRSLPDSNISQAARSADLIDSKAVLVERYLRTH